MTILPVTVNAYVDWNQDGDFGDSNEDISGYVLSVDISRGRSSWNDQFAAGRCSLMLDNQTGLFSVYKAAGALFGSLLPGPAVKVTATHNAVTYPLYYGYLSELGEERQVEGAPLVPLTALDAFDVLSRAKVRLDLLEGKRIDELLDAILDDADFSASLRDLDVANTTLDRFWIYRGNGLDAVQSAAKQELGGQLFVDASGNVCFRERYSRAGAATYATLTGMRAIRGLGINRQQLYDKVHYQRAGLSADTVNTVLFSQVPSGYRLAPGLNSIYGEYQVAGKSVVSPVATTDYLANAQADGLGVDKTGQVTVDSFTSYGGGFSLVLNNLDSADVYLTLNSSASFNVRGLAVRQSTDDRMVEVDTPSPIVAGQTLQDSFDYNDDALAIRAKAMFDAQTFSGAIPRPVIDVSPRSDAEMAMALGAELGSKLVVSNTSGLYPTQMSDTFYVENITLSLGPGVKSGGNINATWTLFQRDLAAGRFFRISGALGDGMDYSAIAPAVTTGAYDRLAY